MRHAGLCLVLLAATASAEPTPASELFRQATDPSLTAAQRVDAAERLAIRFDRDADARERALAAVIDGDAAVRAPLVQAIVDARIATRQAAAHIPTRGVLARALIALRRFDPKLARGDCAIVPGDPSEIRVTCKIVERDACRRASATIVVWPQVRAIAQSVKDIGKCGCTCCGSLDPS